MLTQKGSSFLRFSFWATFSLLPEEKKSQREYTQKIRVKTKISTIDARPMTSVMRVWVL